VSVRNSKAAWGLAAALPLCACAVEEPPGRSAIVPAEPRLAEPAAIVQAAVAVDTRSEGKASEPGHGAKIASIAMRTWVYVAPEPRADKLGYLRAGAVVDRAEASAGTDGCAGGWYRIAPRGYVCVGKGAALALDHQIVLAAVRGPNRQGLPYAYVMSRHPPPHLYFRLPSRPDQERTEGSTLSVHLARAEARPSLAAVDPVPSFLQEGRDLPKPYGSEEKLHYSVHTGRAKEQSAFGLITSFEWTGRRFGLTTELDLIALDRTRPAPVSTLRGLVIDAPGTPAFVKHHGVSKLREGADGRLRDAGPVLARSGVVLTGQRRGAMVEATDGSWLPESSLVVAELRTDPSGYARAGRKWIDISIKRQLLVAYEGERPVFAALVSTGRGGMADPTKTHATVRGLFTIRAKHVSGTMDGEEGGDAFDLRDVPWVQYFHEGYAIHGAYWHDEFGKERSHGCVNLSPEDARWLFDWTDPVVPPDWHGAVSPSGGTLVWTHG
jgi:hypothetical protein